MHRYSGTTLIERQIEAERLRQRYRSDPDYRLYQVNKSRRRTGKPLIGSADQIKSKRELAAQRQRDEAGKFA